MTRFERCFLALVAVRAVTIVLEGAPVGALILLGVVAALAGRWGLLSVAAFVVNATMGGSNSLMLMGSVAAALALFDGAELEKVLRVQAAVVYGFAGVHKLFPNFLSGSVIAYHAPWMPHPELVAPVVVFTELLLAVAVAPALASGDARGGGRPPGLHGRGSDEPVASRVAGDVQRSDGATGRRGASRGRPHLHEPAREVGDR